MAVAEQAQRHVALSTFHLILRALQWAVRQVHPVVAAVAEVHPIMKAITIGCAVWLAVPVVAAVARVKRALMSEPVAVAAVAAAPEAALATLGHIDSSVQAEAEAAEVP